MATVAETRTTRRRTTQRRGTESPSRAATTTRRRSAATTSTPRATRAREQKKTTVPVPVVTPHVTVHRFQVPTPQIGLAGHQVVDAGKAMASSLPPPGRLAYYTGLGALAAFGLVDWPVAAAIGVGVAVARRATGRQRAGQTQTT
ncbi:hypothetical protein ABZ801_39840 [Actinomadura sp. NPDC047616]|uniref:hypothetical protein n=1 Tax=Actinomadura sp. NPDC047616 TaxID=3155914 RepID=UPI0033E2B946